MSSHTRSQSNITLSGKDSLKHGGLSRRNSRRRLSLQRSHREHRSMQVLKLIGQERGQTQRVAVRDDEWGTFRGIQDCGIEEMLLTDAGVDAAAELLGKDNSDLLEFLRSANHSANLIQRQLRRVLRLANGIHSRFLTETSLSEVCLTHTTQTLVDMSVESRSLRSIAFALRKAADEVVKEVQNDTFRRFVGSDTFLRCKQDVIERMHGVGRLHLGVNIYSATLPSPMKVYCKVLIRPEGGEADREDSLKTNVVQSNKPVWNQNMDFAGVRPGDRVCVWLKSVRLATRQTIGYLELNPPRHRRALRRRRDVAMFRSEKRIKVNPRVRLEFSIALLDAQDTIQRPFAAESEITSTSGETSAGETTDTKRPVAGVEPVLDSKGAGADAKVPPPRASGAEAGGGDAKVAASQTSVGKSSSAASAVGVGDALPGMTSSSKIRAEFGDNAVAL